MTQRRVASHHSGGQQHGRSEGLRLAPCGCPHLAREARGSPRRRLGRSHPSPRRCLEPAGCAPRNAARSSAPQLPAHLPQEHPRRVPGEPRRGPRGCPPTSRIPPGPEHPPQPPGGRPPPGTDLPGARPRSRWLCAAPPSSLPSLPPSFPPSLPGRGVPGPARAGEGEREGEGAGAAAPLRPAARPAAAPAPLRLLPCRLPGAAEPLPGPWGGPKGSSSLKAPQG